jgi:hypothetical protein
LEDIMKRQVTYRLAMAAGQDAGNRSMRRHGRTVWNVEDWNAASRTFAKLAALIPQGRAS